MANTTNFGWETPDDTDLVKDGAAAMRTLGNSIDSSFVDLKGGTTGQILSKNSNTDLDYVWINNDQGDITAVTAGTGLTGGGTAGAVTLTNDMATTITAAGDIVVGTGSGTYDNLPIGTTGQVLTADTTVSPYKVKWAAGTTTSWVKLGQTTFSAVASQAFDGLFTATYKHYIITMDGIYGSSSSSAFLFQFRKTDNTTHTANYYGGALQIVYNSSTATILNTNAGSSAKLSNEVGNSADPSSGMFFVSIASSSGAAVRGFFSNGNAGTDYSPNFTCAGSGGFAGFLLSAASGTITGRATVYGVAE